MLSTRPSLSLCASNKLSSGSNEARNCKLSGEAQWRDKGLVFAGNVHGDESDTAESHARMGVMIPPLLWRVMFNPLYQCIHLQIFLSPLICINILHMLFNTDLSDSIFPLVLTIISVLLLNHSFFFLKEKRRECAADFQAIQRYCWSSSNSLQLDHTDEAKIRHDLFIACVYLKENKKKCGKFNMSNNLWIYFREQS